ncbi:MAG: Eco57I restriction-modification methylase domain-containing protein [Verrucomicrobia bacterium]|nr:Eco57I restriction-modification methylase domain-containing protein [Verrucomicrobiota bacterium]
MPAYPLLDDTFLRAQWSTEFEAFQNGPESAALLERLRAWARRDPLNERASEAAFIQRFFVETWGYRLQGDLTPDYTCRPQFEVGGAGQSGGTGFADLALGRFGSGGDGIPQTLCEFKDIRSGLDAKQARKGNTRSPVEQCFDYLHAAWQTRDRDALVEPFFALVTDMTEFRLYARRLGRGQCQRFVLSESGSATEPGLLADTPAAAFRRFVFWRMFRPDMLLAERGAPLLDRLLRDQIVREKAIEKDFYREYRDYRQFVYLTLVEANPGFTGTRGQLVRLTQRFLDRCIFILFCEDMGRVLRYPPALLREILIEKSQSRFYDPEGSGPWDEMRALFRAMRDGGNFGSHPITRFNGGLFEEDPALDSLIIPAKVFCAHGQATNLLGHPRTLLYFSAAYNFGLSSAAGERAISLHTLGRIFEQSITELEIMEAEADGRPSINLLSKRKTDGVYYTPEWVVNMIIEQTVGARLEDIKAELGFANLAPLDDAAIAEYRAYLKDKRRTAPTASKWIKFLDDYRFRVDHLRIVDPACGSGAFLIQALNRLVEEYRWVLAEKERLEGGRGLFDQDSIIRSILSYNIYGVDINQESVEITKLALWLHTAAPGKPLCSLDSNIRCGNSLVGPDFADFYRGRHQTLFDQADGNERERINAFDWHAAVPEVFSHGGFDCVIGNPPYIKLQHFRRAQEDVAAYLVEANHPDGSPLYASTRSGNFDMYLPFIEKGLRLLKPEGRMGYIAPNVWMVNEYGQPLRQLVRRTGCLDRWLDFKSHQIFDEAITYTALQFFRGSPVPALTCAFAPDGNAAAVDWQKADKVPFEELPRDEAWTLAPKAEMELIARLGQTCKTLEQCAKGIVVGIQTSADDIYHLKRLGPNKYETRKGIEVAIEDALMHPLVSGPEAKRYRSPRTETYLLFPYTVEGLGKAHLIPANQMQAVYPLGWAYLLSRESDLRKRENKSFDDDEWYRFGRNQNIDKQELPKLIVAQTVPSLRVCNDPEAAFHLNNVRVNGILTANPEDGWYLLGILNAPVCDFVFRRTAKAKEGGYYEANKQFIAPLPIPDATPEERMEVGQRARELQELHTRRRDTIAKLDQRLNSAQTTPVTPAPKEDWLWAEVGTPASWKHSPAAPAGLPARELTAWAKQRHAAALQQRLDTLDALLQPGATPTVTNTDDELALHLSGREALRLYDKPDTPFLAAQWRHALRDLNITESFNAPRLLKLLLTLRTTNEPTLRDRVLTLDTEITTFDQTIATKEAELNAIIYKLYRLKPEEVGMVEGG